MILNENTLSSNIALGRPIDMGWLNALGSDAVGWLKKGAASAWNYTKKIGQGAKAVVDSIKQGNFKQIFDQWAKEDPLAAGAGVIAAGLAGGAILLVGGAAVAWVTGGLGAMAGSLGIFGAGVAATNLGSIVEGVMNQAETIYQMDWQQSDEDIMAEMQSVIDGLYSPAGEFIGRSIAQLLVGGITSPPKVQINVNSLTYQWIINPEIRDDLLSNVSQLAWTAIYAFRTLAVKYALLKGRQGIKGLWKDLPPEVRKQFPELDKAVKTWGDKDKEPWSLENAVNTRIEKIDDTKLRNAAEGALTGFWQGFRESVEYVYQ